MYAVNLIALMNLSQLPVHLPIYWLLSGIVTDTVIRDDEERMGHEALLVRDDVEAERWHAIVKIVRINWRKEQFPLYETKGSRWVNV